MSTGSAETQEQAPLTVQVWSDYTCPFCHIGRERVTYLEREYGAQVQWPLTGWRHWPRRRGFHITPTRMSFRAAERRLSWPSGRARTVQTRTGECMTP